MTYLIGFYVVLGIIFTLLSFFIWICVENGRNEKIVEISNIGLKYMIKNYLLKSFQKVCVLLLKNRDGTQKTKITKETTRTNQSRFCEHYEKRLTEDLMGRARGLEIVQTIYENILKNNFEEMILFLFPDVVLSNNDYYKNLLLWASENTLNSPICMENQEAKNFLGELDKKMSRVVKEEVTWN